MDCLKVWHPPSTGHSAGLPGISCGDIGLHGRQSTPSVNPYFASRGSSTPDPIWNGRHLNLCSTLFLQRCALTALQGRLVHFPDTGLSQLPLCRTALNCLPGRGIWEAIFSRPCTSRNVFLLPLHLNGGISGTEF